MQLKWTSSEFKELILGVLSLLWGLLLLLPGNSLLPYGGFGLYRFYAEDGLWGTYLIIAGSVILIFSAGGFNRLRKFFHATLWIFWLGISALILIRTLPNGVSETDILIILPFVAIAFLHAAIYARLAATL